jgi:hypothetical protein
MPYNHEILKKEILIRSKSKEWEPAKLEWDLTRVILLNNENAEKCLCSHYPIKELCFIKNRETGEETLVGNCCVKKFMEKDTTLHFSTLKTIIKQPEEPLSKVRLSKLSKKGIIHRHKEIDYNREIAWISKPDSPYYKESKKKITTYNREIKWTIEGYDPFKKIVGELKKKLDSYLLKQEDVEFIFFLPDNTEKLANHEKARITTLAQKMDISPE